MRTDRKKGKLFLDYAKPDSDGKSDWMDVKNIPNKYKELYSNNGYSWSREKSQLNEDYIVEKQYKGAIGKSPLLKMRLVGKR